MDFSIIQSSPAIIENILKCFCAKDLRKLAGVCHSWHFYATKILSTRQNVACVSYKKPGGGRNRERSKWIALGDVPEVKEALETLPFEPHLALIFGKMPLSRPCTGGHDLMSIRARLPGFCKIVGVVGSDGIVATYPSNIREHELPRTDCFSSYLLSDTFSQHVTTFDMTMESWQQCLDDDSGNVIWTGLTDKLGLRLDEPLKSLIIISPKYFPTDIVEKLITAIYENSPQSFALAGGITNTVYRVEAYGNEARDSGLIGVAFYGDKIQTASIVLDNDQGDTMGVKRRLMQLKKSLQLQPANNQKCQKSLGFMFACCARGKRYYDGHPEIESTMFHEYFPDTPLLGMFSMGEVGWIFPGEREHNGVLACTTVFTVIRFLV